jgi:F0F1-type ATP synthase assembly protein I
MPAQCFFFLSTIAVGMIKASTPNPTADLQPFSFASSLVVSVGVGVVSEDSFVSSSPFTVVVSVSVGFEVSVSGALEVSVSAGVVTSGYVYASYSASLIAFW